MWNSDLGSKFDFLKTVNACVHHFLAFCSFQVLVVVITPPVKLEWAHPPPMNYDHDKMMLFLQFTSRTLWGKQGKHSPCLRRFDLSIHTLHRCHCESMASRLTSSDIWRKGYLIGHGSRWAIEGLSFNWFQSFEEQWTVRAAGHQCSSFQVACSNLLYFSFHGRGSGLVIIIPVNLIVSATVLVI